MRVKGAGLAILIASILLMLCVSIAVASTPKPTFTAKEGFIPVKYGKIWFRIVGIDKPGVPLLVLHGGPGMTHYYLESLEALADQRPVIFYDQLGCGNSKATTKNLALFCTVQSFVDEVDTVRKALGLKKVHILGHSWGSMLAVEYMTRKNPKGVLSLILAGPYMSTRRWISDAKSLLKTLPTDIQKTVEECEAQKDFDNPKYQQAMMVFYKLFFCRLDPWPPCLEKAFQTMGYDVYNYMWGPSEFTCTGVLKNHDITQKLKQLKVPVLYICGEFDEARPETTKYYQSITPGAKMYVIKGASHCHHLEKPKIFNKIVREFLSEHDK